MIKDRREIMAILNRVKERHDEPDQKLLVALLEDQLANLEGQPANDAKGEINFCPIGKRFLINETELRMRKGFVDLTELLKNPDENIACRILSPIVDLVEFEPCAMHFSLVPELNDPDYLTRLLTVPGQIGNTEINTATPVRLEKRLTYGLVRRKEQLISTLEAMREDRDPDEPELLNLEREAQVADELTRIEKALSRSTFGGKIKHAHNAYDQCRQRVSKRIREAIQVIESHPDIAYIGQHLRNNVKTGCQCCYFGEWRCWRF